ncbi:iron-containing alcohol dehydrogenase [Sphingobium baderi]|nr:iron-containing alcohol dehydrogenase [Sphingobium baderi]ALR22282.1 alcohol dehydrogenase [Sphingobium baderi]ARR57532.1 maleylacetate reductase [Rhizorhabdus wittichii DC-6]
MIGVNSGTVKLSSTERVRFGQPTAQALAEELELSQAKGVMVIASQSLASTTDEIANVEKALGERHAVTFTGVAPHVPHSDVIAAANVAREYSADLIVSIGGGSVTDCAKLVPFCLSNDLRSTEALADYHIRVGQDGTIINPANQPLFNPQTVRTICIPTTLSGGEFNSLSGSTDAVSMHKHLYEHRMMAPVTVILDPGLSRHTPEWLFLSTGVRALDHAIETLQSFQSNDYCDGLADSALRLLVEGLPRVKADPGDLEARLKCQVGVWQSMLPVISGVPMGASHAIGHVLGGLCAVPHGYTSCVMSPAVLWWNASVNGERQKRIAAAFGEPGTPAGDLVAAFISALKMPRALSAVNVTEDQFPAIAEYTMQDIWSRTNPREITGPSDLLEILVSAK